MKTLGNVLGIRIYKLYKKTYFEVSYVKNEEMVNLHNDALSYLRK